MTDREKAIVMAHTGICMLTGDKFKIFHGYVEDIMGRSVWTHELGIGTIADEIKEKSKDDFIALCADKLGPGHWIKKKGMIYCSECGDGFDVFNFYDPFKYCPSCGMRNEVEE